MSSGDHAPTPPALDGRYRVAATWFTNTDFRTLFSAAAPFEVSDSATIRGTKLVNMQYTPLELGGFSDSGADWFELGVFDVTSSTLTVKLSTAFDNTYVTADAVRIERVAGLFSTAEIQVTAPVEAAR